MSNAIYHLTRQIHGLTEKANSLSDQEARLTEDIRHIDIDLSNTIDEFVATTGRAASEFYSWRRKAKWARAHKLKAIGEVQAEMVATKQALTNAKLALYAEESGYRGSDPELLLRALYHFTMDILDSTGHAPDQHALGLIATVRERTERTTPKGVL